MKKVHIIFSVIGLHIVLITVQIHKQSTFIKLTYHKQHMEQTERTLRTIKNQRAQQLAALSNPSTIQKYGLNELGLCAMKLRQLHRLDDHENTV